VGSNNLTRDGLLYNIEFAVLIRARAVPTELVRWGNEVASGSVAITESLIATYELERTAFEKKQARAKTATFTWSKKKEPPSRRVNVVRRGDLVLEIMPEETRGGNQIQIPKEAAKAFFGLRAVGEQRAITLQRIGARQSRRLVITVFSNNTVRLSVNELEYGDRPCVVVLRKGRKDRILFEIVPENVFPTRYRTLIAMCAHQTRAGSRRWIIR
jgi:hypothetical protein